MLIAAIGDAHLGRSYYPATAESGVNQRERDFEVSFEAAVGVALGYNPDLVVWLGDIFDHPRPSYRSYQVAQRALAAIRDHGAKAVIISGNHDTPRLPGKGSPYATLADSFPEMHFAHRMSYERFDFPGLAIHAVPQTLTVRAAIEALGEAAAGRVPGRTNLLLTHPRLRQLQPRHADINEIEVDQELLQSDLVLLGHYHTFTTVSETMWYAGAPDTFSFADEPDRSKGIVLLDSDTGLCRPIEVAGRRRLVTLESVYALGLAPSEIQGLLEERANTVPGGSVARLYVEGVDPDVWRLLDRNAVRDAAQSALHLKIEPQFVSRSLPAELPEMGGLGAQWARYLAGQDLAGLDSDKVRQLGLDYLDTAILGGPAPSSC